MRFSKRLIRWVAQLVIAVLVMAHGIHFAQACIVNADRPAMAFASADHCKMQGKQAPVYPNACLTQCLQTDQSWSAQPVDIPAANNAVVFILPVAFVHTPMFDAPALDCLRSGSPPLALRFCSFQL